MKRSHVASLLVVFLSAGILQAADESVFVPLPFAQGNTENRTGMWLCADLGTAADILPLKTRIWATKESVTGGVALKCVFEPGSQGSLNFENEEKPPAGAGITLYAKASRPLTLNVSKAKADVGTDWKKIDLTWEAMGTTAEKRDVGSHFTIAVAGPIRERTWLIIDRLGVERPDFIAKPKIDPQSGPDPALSSKDILYGTANLARTLARAKARQSFKIYAFGDSITLGAQMYRGTWKVRGDAGVPFLYHNHLARLWEEHFGYKGITVVHGGQAGSLKAWHLQNLGTFLKDATADDVVIIALSGGSPAAWKENLEQLITTAKTKTDQVILMSPTPGGAVLNQSTAMTAVLKELVEEQKVAVADITKFALYRGEPYCWAGEGNEWHPTYELHITMAEMMAPLLTGEERVWPEPPAGR